jgi:hypothetical protein
VIIFLDHNIDKKIDEDDSLNDEVDDVFVDVNSVQYARVYVDSH